MSEFDSRTDRPPRTFVCRFCRRAIGAFTDRALAVGDVVFCGSRIAFNCKHCGRRNEWRRKEEREAA